MKEKKKKYQINIVFDDEDLEALGEVRAWIERCKPELKGKLKKSNTLSAAVAMLRDICRNEICLRGTGRLGSMLTIQGPSTELLWRTADALIKPYEENPEISPGMGEGLRTGDGFAFLLTQGLYSLRREMQREKAVFVLPSQMTAEDRKVLFPER